MKEKAKFKAECSFVFIWLKSYQFPEANSSSIVKSKHDLKEKESKSELHFRVVSGWFELELKGKVKEEKSWKEVETKEEEEEE